MKTEKSTQIEMTKQLDAAKKQMNVRNYMGAETILRDVLSNDNENAEALGLMAEIYALRGEKSLAKMMWAHALQHSDQPSVFYANLRALLRALFIEKNRTEALKHVDKAFPDWPATQAPSASERTMLLELVGLLVSLNSLDKAYHLLEMVSRAMPNDLEILANLGLLQMQLSDYEKALKTFSAVDQAIQPDTDLSILVRLYQCAGKLQDRQLMESLVKRATDASPIHMMPNKPEHKKNLLIIDRSLKLNKTIKAGRASYLDANFATQLVDKFSDEFHFSSIFAYTESSRNSKDQLPQPDIIINNIANAEVILTDDSLSVLSDFVDSFGVPVVNHPHKVVSTSRQQMVALLENLPEVVVPRTASFSKGDVTDRELMDAIEAQFGFPLITRTLAAQQGIGMSKVDDRKALVSILPELPETFYVTEFIDNRDQTGLYRKIRAAIVGNEVIIVRVDHDTNWNVHGRPSSNRERVRFYQDNTSLLAIEERICSNPAIELGQQVMQQLEGIRQRIPLDIFGIDFDVTRDGKVLFFEANASMNLFSTADVAVNYPAQAEQRLLGAFSRFFEGFENRRH